VGGGAAAAITGAAGAGAGATTGAAATAATSATAAATAPASATAAGSGGGARGCAMGAAAGVGVGVGVGAICGLTAACTTGAGVGAGAGRRRKSTPRAAAMPTTAMPAAPSSTGEVRRRGGAAVGAVGLTAGAGGKASWPKAFCGGAAACAGKPGVTPAIAIIVGSMGRSPGPPWFAGNAGGGAAGPSGPNGPSGPMGPGLEGDAPTPMIVA
jgi:hypothetical protein